MKIAIVTSGMNMGGIYKSLLSFLMEIKKREWDVDLYVLSGHRDDIRKKVYDANIKDIFMYKSLQIYDRALYEQEGHIDRLKKIICGCSVRLVGRRFVVERLIDHLPIIDKAYDVAISYSHSILKNGNRHYSGGCEYFVDKKISAKKKIAWIHSDPDKLGYTDEVCKSLFSGFNKIVCVSRGCMQKFQNNCPELRKRATVFYNICNEDKIKKKALEHLPYRDINCIKLITVCRLVEEAKGLSIIASVCRDMMNAGYNFKWYIVGDGRDRGLLEGLISKYAIEDYLMLEGFQPNPYPYIANADLYVCTSRIEAFGISVREAQILGVPALMTPVISAEELIENGKNGIITGFDEKSIRRDLSRLLEKPERINELKKGLDTDAFRGSTIEDFEKIIGGINE